MDQNYSSVKISNQFQWSKTPPNNSIDLEGTHLNSKDGTCWLKHCYKKKFYECWWYRGLWKFAVDLECIFLNNVKRP